MKPSGRPLEELLGCSVSMGATWHGLQEHGLKGQGAAGNF
jgi:hypothetical protein